MSLLLLVAAAGGMIWDHSELFFFYSLFVAFTTGCCAVLFFVCTPRSIKHRKIKKGNVVYFHHFVCARPTSTFRIVTVVYLRYTYRSIAPVVLALQRR